MAAARCAAAAVAAGIAAALALAAVRSAAAGNIWRARPVMKRDLDLMLLGESAHQWPYVALVATDVMHDGLRSVQQHFYIEYLQR